MLKLLDRGAFCNMKLALEAVTVFSVLIGLGLVISLVKNIKRSGKFSNSDKIALLGIISALAIACITALFSSKVDTNHTATPGIMHIKAPLTLMSPAQESTTDAPTLIPTPVASAGAELYSISDWSKGMSGWSTVQGWKTVDNMLVNDGSVPNDFVWTIAPFTPFKADYAVEVQLQRVGKSSGEDYQSTGIVMRGGNNKGYLMEYNGEGSALIITMEHVFVNSYAIDKWPFEPGNDWHTYRAEVKGNKVRLLIDGTVIIDATDNQYLDPGQVGLWSKGFQVNIRSFKVINL